MRFRLMTVLTVLWLCGQVAAVPAHADERPDRPLITVSGQAEVRVPPDEAVLRMRVVTLDKDLAVAMTRNDERVKAILALGRELGVKAEHMQTSSLAIDAKETDRDGQKPVFLGYEVTKRISLLVKDLKRVDDLLAGVVKAGVNRIDRLELRSGEPRKYRDEARVLAIRAAREKASALAREIGQTIGKAFTITEDAPSYNGGSNNLQNVTLAESADSPAVSGAFSAGENAITARVTVSFELQ